MKKDQAMNRLKIVKPKEDNLMRIPPMIDIPKNDFQKMNKMRGFPL